MTLHDTSTQALVVARRIGTRAWAATALARRRSAPVTSRVAPVVQAVSPVGRTVLALSVLAWIAGARLGWEELLVVAAAGLLVVLFGLAFTVGKARLVVDMEVLPPRVVVGQAASARLGVTNTSSRRILGVRLEAPVGAGVARFQVPSLARGGHWDDLVVIPTSRRSIVPIGPVHSIRDDPLGLARREATWTDVVELFVHPHTVRLVGLTAGWLRDLEGQATNDRSPSDVAFHTLREYVPGDDRRHIHWRTSARLGQLMVRQFVDTRRSDLGVLLTTHPAAYGDGDEFELAVSVVGSLGVSALADDQALTVASGAAILPAVTTTRLLDALAGVELGDAPLPVADLVARLRPQLTSLSVAVLVVGSGVEVGELLAAASRFPVNVQVLAMRCVGPGVPGGMNVRRRGRLTVLDLASLDELVRVVRGKVSR